MLNIKQIKNETCFLSQASEKSCPYYHHDTKYKYFLFSQFAVCCDTFLKTYCENVKIIIVNFFFSFLPFFHFSEKKTPFPLKKNYGIQAFMMPFPENPN